MPRLTSIPCVVLAMLVLVARSGPASAGSVHDPMHRITFPAGSTAHSAAYAADGRTIFVRLHDTAINAWEVLCYYWPELLGGVCGVVLIVCALLIHRTLGRKRLVGEPHCRWCGYCLKGAAGPHCTECGRAIRRPLIGRPMWKRVLPAVSVAVLFLALYGSLWLTRAPRSGYASNWLNWWSRDLHAWSATTRFAWLSARGQPVDRVVEIDVASGRMLRTLITRPAHASGFSIAVTPDGSGLLLPVHGDRLALVSTRSGRMVRTFEYGAPSRQGRWQEVAGFDDAGRTAFVTFADVPARATRLLALDMESGAITQQLEAGLEIETNFGGTMTCPARFYRVPVADRRLFFELPPTCPGEMDATGFGRL